MIYDPNNPTQSLSIADTLPGAPQQVQGGPAGVGPSLPMGSAGSVLDAINSKNQAGGSSPSLPGAPGAGSNFGISSMFPNPLGIGGDISGQIKNYLSGVLNGKNLPFGPDQIAALTAQAKANTSGAASAASQAARDEAVRRGVFRSPFAARAESDIQRSAASQFTQQATGIQLQAVQQNYNARMAALDRMEKWLDNLRSFAAQMDANSSQREEAIAQIALGYANIAAQRDRLQMSFQHEFDLLQANKIPLTINGQTIYVPAQLIPSLMGS